MRCTSSSTAATRPSASSRPSSPASTTRRACCGPASSRARRFEQVVGELDRPAATAPRAPGDRRAALRAVDAARDRGLGRSRGARRRDPRRARRKSRCSPCGRRLHTQRYMTWINAGKRPDTYAHNLYNHSAHPGPRGDAREFSCRSCRRTSAGRRSSIACSAPAACRRATRSNCQRASELVAKIRSRIRVLCPTIRWSSIRRRTRSRASRSSIWWRATARRCS